MLVGLSPGAAFAQVETTTAPAALIIDSSGSMAAREPDGRVKLDAARAVVEDALKAWPAERRLAVVAYGHRRQSDCADIETIVPLGAVSTSVVHDRLAALRARGKTPISRSLVHAAGLLPEGDAAIVLVSDGLETCEADPCAVAAELKRANPRLVIHVVGFGLAEGEAAQLSCIARNAGGRFLDAGSAEDLASAMTTVVETVAAEPAVPEAAPAPEPPPVVDTPAPEPPPAPVPEPPQVVRVGIAAVAGGLGRLVDAPVRWVVRDTAGVAIYEGESRGLSLDLAEGSYGVEAYAANARGGATIEVSGELGQEFDVEVDAGRLDLSLSAGKVAPPFSDLEAAGTVWTLEPRDGQGAVEMPKLARPSLLLAPGRYLVRARLKGLEAEAEATVATGAAAALRLDVPLGALVLEAALAEEEPALTDASMLAWRVGEGDTAQLVAGQARPRLVLPEGKYAVALSIAGGEVLSAADVVADEERLLRVVVGGGELELGARLGPESPPVEDWRDAYWTLTAQDGPAAGQEIVLPAAAPVVPVPPGRWRISVQSGTVVVEHEVTVGPGGRSALVFDLDAARLGIKAAPADGGPLAMNTVFSVYAVGTDGAAAEAPVYSGGASEEVSTIVPSGRWLVIAEDSDGRRGTAEVDLGAGEETTVELPLR